MATYSTKFSIGDTAYFTNPLTLNIVHASILDIYIHESNISSDVKISYRVRYISDYSGKNLLEESSLFYLEEAKARIAQLLSERATDVANLR